MGGVAAARGEVPVGTGASVHFVTLFWVFCAQVKCKTVVASEGNAESAALSPPEGRSNAIRSSEESA